MTDSPTRGEVWLVRLDPAVGSEIQKTRPAVVISSSRFDRVSLRLMVPLTSWQPRFARHPNKSMIRPTAQNGLDKDSAADALQTRSLSVERFVHKIGEVAPHDLKVILANLIVVVEYG